MKYNFNFLCIDITEGLKQTYEWYLTKDSK